MARTKTPANIVGPQIRKRRSELDLTQEELATRCQLQGFDISRGTLSQIEAQLRCVTDDELLALARVLKVTTDSLFPTEKRARKTPVSKQPNRSSR
jgi:transcriptional regulator with XRE-family HTH domain